MICALPRWVRSCRLWLPLVLAFSALPLLLPTNCVAQDESGALPPAIKTMIWTEMRMPVDLRPVMAAAARAGCAEVSSSAYEICLKFAGTSNNYAYVRSNGEITIASALEINRLEDMDILDSDLQRVYGFIAQVSSGIPEEVRQNTLYYNLVYYFEDPTYFKRIVFPAYVGPYNGELHVPDCTVEQARVTVMGAPGLGGGVALRGKVLFNTYDNRKRFGIDVTSDVAFGTHSLGIWKHMARMAAVAVEAITSQTPDTIYYTGNNVENAIISRVLPLTGTLPRPQAPALPGGGRYEGTGEALGVLAWTPDQPIKAQLDTTFGVNIKLTSVKATVVGLAKKAQYQERINGEEVACFQSPKDPRNWIYVRANGALQVCSPQPLLSFTDLDALHQDLATAVGFVCEVNGEAIPEEAKCACLYQGKYSLPAESKDTYKRLVFPPGTYDGTLIVPQGEIKQARVSVFPSPGMSCEVKLDKSGVYNDLMAASKPGAYQRLLTAKSGPELQPGSHPFECRKLSRRAATVVVEAITSPLSEPLVFQGEGAEAVKAAVVEALPAPEPAPQPQKPAEPSP